jgi:hypothetical protein
MAETGHVKNVENLKNARDFATSWGAAYVPSNPNLAIRGDDALGASGDAMRDDILVKRTPYCNATVAYNRSAS